MELIDAAENGDIISVREYLDNGWDPDIVNVNSNGETALMEASGNGHTEIVKLLLDRGADPNIQDDWSYSTLMKASEYGHTEIAELLLDNLDNGVDPDIINRRGDTALIMATESDDTEMVKLLLDRGADPDIRDGWGRTALMEAERMGHYNIARLIQEHIDLQRSLQDLSVATSFIPRLGYDTPLRYLDNDTLVKIMSSRRPNNPGVNRRIREELQKDPSTKALQRLAIMKAMHFREGPFSSVRYDPSIIEGIDKHLSLMRPYPAVQNRMILEDERMRLQNRQQDTINDEEWEELYREHPELRGSGRGKRSSKKLSKRKSRFY